MRERGRVGPESLDLFSQTGAERRPASLHLERRSQGGGNVYQFGTAGRRKLGRHYDTKVAEERNDVTRPANRNGNCPDGVLQNQVPADNPSEQLPQGGVAVSVGAAGHRDQRSEFAVTQRGKNRSDP